MSKGITVEGINLGCFLKMECGSVKEDLTMPTSPASSTFTQEPLFDITGYLELS